MRGSTFPPAQAASGLPVSPHILLVFPTHFLPTQTPLQEFSGLSDPPGGGGGGGTKKKMPVSFGHQRSVVASAGIWASSWKAGSSSLNQALLVFLPLPAAPVSLSPPSLHRSSHFSTFSFCLLSVKWDFPYIYLQDCCKHSKGECTDRAFI